jgi:hypothetical protein
MTTAAILAIVLPLVVPGLIHLIFSPDPTSKWGMVIDRARKLGFDPAAFEPEANRLAKAALDKADKS